MDFIDTIIEGIPHMRRNVETMFCSFPHHRSVSKLEINESDISMQNLTHIENYIKKLEFSKKKLEKRIKMLDEQIENTKSILEKVKKKRKENEVPIETIDDDLYI